MRLNYYLDGKLSQRPRNADEIELQLNFDNDNPSASLQGIVFEFLGENATKINAWISAGTSGGVGIFEGMPFRIETCGAGLVIFDGVLDLANTDTEIECDFVKCPLKESGKIDFLNDIADSFTFAYLAEEPTVTKGKITSADYVQVPYVVSEIPNYMQAVLLGLSIFVISKEVAENIQTVSKLIDETAYVPTTVLGLAKITFYLIYIASLLIALIQLMKTLLENIIQFDKYKLAMQIETLFTRACQYLGFDFSSTIIQGSMYTILPKKTILNSTKKKNVLGVFPQLSTIAGDEADLTTNPDSYGYYDGTFGDLLRQLMDVFNAKVRILKKGNKTTLYFERFDFWNNQASYTLPNIQRRNADPHRTNASELASNYYIRYQTDSVELNTYDEYSGTSVQVILSPKIVGNQKNVLLKNLTNKNLAFALGKRKETLTLPEQIISFVLNNALGLFLSILFGLLGLIIAIAGKKFVTPLFPALNPNKRIGYLLLSSDFTGVQKLIKIATPQNVHGVLRAELASDNKEKTSAEYLLNTYHNASLPVTANKNVHNQYLLYRDKIIPMCCTDFLKIRDNNVIKTFDQKYARVESLLWNIHDGTAKINYRVKQRYTDNLKLTTIIDGK